MPREAVRRSLVTPGLTGLWQISGRSNLAAEDSIRLDLRYVENWSLALDLLILLKTASAVLARRGAALNDASASRSEVVVKDSHEHSQHRR